MSAPVFICFPRVSAQLETDLRVAGIIADYKSNVRRFWAGADRQLGEVNAAGPVAVRVRCRSGNLENIRILPLAVREKRCRIRRTRRLRRSRLDGSGNQSATRAVIPAEPPDIDSVKRRSGVHKELNRVAAIDTPGGGIAFNFVTGGDLSCRNDPSGGTYLGIFKLSGIVERAHRHLRRGCRQGCDRRVAATTGKQQYTRQDEDCA